MPWNGLPERLWDEMDRCVEQVMADGHDKEAAIRICMASLRKKVEGAEQDDGAAQQDVVGADGIVVGPVSDEEYNVVRAAYGSRTPRRGDMLAFRGAILAKAERNANGDYLSEQNLAELAETIPMCPMSTSHAPQASVVGVYTAGRVDRRTDGTYLVTDGILWMRKAKDAVVKILSGVYKQSIEAVSDEVECSVCGQRFRDTSYCAHLQPILQGMALPDGVSRRHYRMRAVGGALVTAPAGTNAGFDTGVFMMATQHPVTAQEENNMTNPTPVDVAEPDALRRVSELEAQIAQLRQELEQANRLVTVVASRAMAMVQAGFALEEVNGLLGKLGSMDEDVFNLLCQRRAASASQVQAAAAQPPAPKLIFGGEQAPAVRSAPTWHDLLAVKPLTS